MKLTFLFDCQADLAVTLIPSSRILVDPFTLLNNTLFPVGSRPPGPLTRFLVVHAVLRGHPAGRPGPTRRLLSALRGVWLPFEHGFDDK